MNKSLQHAIEGAAGTVVVAGVLKIIPFLLALPGAVWYCWLLWDKWRSRK
jgi:hypothetical protein